MDLFCTSRSSVVATVVVPSPTDEGDRAAQQQAPVVFPADNRVRKKTTKQAPPPLSSRLQSDTHDLPGANDFRPFSLSTTPRGRTRRARRQLRAFHGLQPRALLLLPPPLQALVLAWVAWVIFRHFQTKTSPPSPTHPLLLLVMHAQQELVTEVPLTTTAATPLSSAKRRKVTGKHPPPPPPSTTTTSAACQHQPPNATASTTERSLPPAPPVPPAPPAQAVEAVEVHEVDVHHEALLSPALRRCLSQGGVWLLTSTVCIMTRSEHSTFYCASTTTTTTVLLCQEDAWSVSPTRQPRGAGQFRQPRRPGCPPRRTTAWYRTLCWNNRAAATPRTLCA
jgi:hypothetical protein